MFISPPTPPEPLKIYATYRMRLMGYWLGKNGLAVINNVRWGTEETYSFLTGGPVMVVIDVFTLSPVLLWSNSAIALCVMSRSSRISRNRMGIPPFHVLLQLYKSHFVILKNILICDSLKFACFCVFSRGG